MQRYIKIFNTFFYFAQFYAILTALVLFGLLPSISIKIYLAVYSIFSVVVLHYSIISNTKNFSVNKFNVFFLLLLCFSLLLSFDLKFLDISELSLFLMFTVQLFIGTHLFLNQEDSLFTKLKTTAFISILLFFFVIATSNFDIAFILNRGYTWTPYFALYGLCWVIPAFLLYSLILEKSLKLSFICTIIYLIWSAIFLKRGPVISIIIVLSLYLLHLLRTKQPGRSLLFILMFSLVTLSAFTFFFDTIIAFLDAYTNRLSFSNGLQEIPRVHELVTVLESLKTYQKFIGSGLLNSLYFYEDGRHAQERHFLHIGYFFLHLKFTLVFTFYLFICLAKLLILYVYRYGQIASQLRLNLLIYFYIKLLWENLYSFNLEFAIFIGLTVWCFNCRLNKPVNKNTNSKSLIDLKFAVTR